MMNQLQPGNEITYGGYEWTVLDIIDGKAFVLSKKSVAKMPFDDKCNNFAKSSLMRYLNGEFISHLKSNGANVDALCDFSIDLTADDGLKDYGEVTVKVGVRTCHQHRKYRDLIPHLNLAEWTATPCSATFHYSNLMRFIHKDGIPGSLYPCNGYKRVRPTMLLDIAVLNLEDERNPLHEYSNEELLQELARRMEK